MYILPDLKGYEIIKYLRKSRADDPLLTVEEVLAKHEEMLDEWMAGNLPNAGSVPDDNVFREVVSGETLQSRPRMQEVLRLVESPKKKAILCYDLSRLSRGDLQDIGYITKVLRYSNTIIITYRQGAYDLNDSRDRDSFERELMQSKSYLEYQKTIQWNGRLLSVKNGNFIGQSPPYGYKKIEIKEGGRKCHTLEPIPEEAEVVRRIFEMYRDGMGRVKIADQLNKEHVPAPKGKKWSSQTLPGLLCNIHYLGKVKWNSRKTLITVEDGEIKKSRPRADEYLVFEGKHPAIIDQELWDEVQAIKGTHPRNKNHANLFNPLAGLLYCSHCGLALVGRKYTNKAGEERCAPRFLCPGQRDCECGSATIDEVMAEVVNVLRENVQDFETRLEAGTDDSEKMYRRTIERLEKKLADLRELEKKQWDEKIKGKMPAHVFEALNGETVAEIEDVSHALYEAKDATPEPVDLREKIVTFQAALDALLDPDAPVKAKNQLLKKCIERIDYKRARKQGNPRWGDSQPLELHFKLRV